MGLALATNLSTGFREAVSGINPQEILARFETEITRSHIKEAPLPGKATALTPPNYRSFDYFPGEGNPTFINTLQNNPEASNADRLISRAHEGTHGTQFNVPIAHASPYNMAAPVVLCPEDFIKFTLLTERAAMAYTALLGVLHEDPAVRNALATQPVTAEDFESALYDSGYDINAALNRTARLSLSRNSNHNMEARGGRQQSEALTLYNYYCWQALQSFHDNNRYKFGMQLYDQEPPIYIKLTDKDIHELGQAMGLSAFGINRADDFFTEPPQLMEGHKRWMEGLNHMYGIKDSQSLPSLEQVLRDNFGITPDEFLAYSKNHKQGDAPLQKTSMQASNLYYLPPR